MSCTIAGETSQKNSGVALEECQDSYRVSLSGSMWHIQFAYNWKQRMFRFPALKSLALDS
jgi:hypothetical protein